MNQENRPLRILHLTADSAPGGVSRYLHVLCEQMHLQGHEVAIAGSPGQWHGLFQGVAWPWIDLPLNGSVKDLWRSFYRLKAYCKQHQVDVLHAHYRKSMMVGACLSGRLAVPMLTTLHLTDIPMSPMHRLFTRFGDHVHAPSEKAKQWLIKVGYVKPDRITVIPHGVDSERFPIATDQQRTAAREAIGISPDAVVAAYAGRYTPEKNVDWLTDLAHESRDQLPHLVVLLIGEGDCEPLLRDKISALDLSDRVKLLPYGDPLDVYRAADAVLLPSEREGFSLMAIEAMSVGRPVFRTDTAGAEEQIIDNNTGGTTGRVVPIDRKQFIDEAMRFLADRQELHRMGQHAAKYVRQELAIDRQIEQTVALYGRLIGERQG